MAVLAGTAQTYQGTVNREDLSDLIYMISPTETPLLSLCGKAKATATLHEWTTDVLATAVNNAQIEGDDSASAAGTINPGTRVTNRTQISKKVVRLSGTQQAVNQAGKIYTMSNQMAKASAEIKRDMEVALTQNTTMVAGSAGVARQTRGLEGWLATNSIFGATGANPVPNSNTGPTDGTQRALTEALLKTTLNNAWLSGGNPDTILLGGIQKQLFSSFTGGGTQFGNLDDKKLIGAIDVYVSDYSTLKLVPDRFQRARTLFALESAKWKVAYLRSFETVALAKTGDSDINQIVVEYALEASNEASSGCVRDLS